MQISGADGTVLLFLLAAWLTRFSRCFRAEELFLHFQTLARGLGALAKLSDAKLSAAACVAAQRVAHPHEADLGARHGANEVWGKRAAS